MGTTLLKVLMIGNTLVVGGVDPAGIDAVMSASGITRWARHVMPPVRMQAGPCLAVDGHEQQAYELVRPSAGLDLQWLVRAGCVIDPDVVAQVLSCGSSRRGRWRPATLGTTVTGE